MENFVISVQILDCMNHVKNLTVESILGSLRAYSEIDHVSEELNSVVIRGKGIRASIETVLSEEQALERFIGLKTISNLCAYFATKNGNIETVTF